MNTIEAKDVAMLLAHMTGTIELDSIDVAQAANRLAKRAEETLKQPPYSIATPAALTTAVRELAQKHADAEYLYAPFDLWAIA